MRRNLLSAFLVAITLVFGLTVATYAQGKGHGRGGGVGGGRGSGVGQPTGVGVGADRSSTRSGGRSDAGLERANMARANRNNADRELRKHPNIASDLHVNANDLRAGYQAALVANPNLTFGHYVAATRLERNLNARHPNVTRAAILTGLANGDSLGRTLQNLGVGKNEANTAVKRAETEFKNSKRKK